jgi:hypothetical protein
MKIWFHGTDLKAAEQIRREGFRAGSWFAEALEDALEFGGKVVFEVALDHRPVEDGNWQMCIADIVPFDAIVSITRYHTGKIFENQTLRKAVFALATNAKTPGNAEAALRKLIRTAQLLQQNSEGCVVNHHGLDFEQRGLLRWLRDTQQSIDEALAVLGPVSAYDKTGGGRCE